MMRTRTLTIVCVYLTITHTFAFIAGILWSSSANPSKSAKVPIQAGVLIPDDMLSGDTLVDLKQAESFLSENYQWQLIKKGKVPGLNGTGFAYETISPDKPATP